jgi:DNA-binding MarR family transcriptional regulator
MEPMTATVRTTQGARGTGHGEDLMRVVGQLRRSVRRRVRQDWPHAPLPETHLELLRLVSERPGLRVREAAGALRLAPNTVSTLVNKLVSAGLLERRRDRRDGRAARLHLTEAAVQRIAAWRDRRQALVARAMETLAAGDREAIAGALPALRRLADALERPS